MKLIQCICTSARNVEQVLVSQGHSRSRMKSRILLYDLVPRFRFGGSRTKKQGRGEGKGEEETRAGKIRIETSADWLFRNGRESSTRVLFLSLAVPKTYQRSFIELKIQQNTIKCI